MVTRWRRGNAGVCHAKRDQALPDPAELDLASRDKTSMYYVYTLKSSKNGDLYIGSCRDLRIRYHQHNQRNVKSTKAYRPWILVYYEAFRSKKDAILREKQLKMHKVKEGLKKQIKCSLNFDGALAKG